MLTAFSSRQILRYTDSDHPDHAALERALHTAEQTLNDINEAIRVNETREKLAWLSHRSSASAAKSSVRTIA